MNISVGDMADRYAICTLKLQRAKIEECIEELDALDYGLRSYRPAIDFNLGRLYEINGSIWDLESDIRKGKEGELGLEEVGRRALLIRNFNNKRVGVKNEINSQFKSGFLEVKKDHASE